MTSNRLITPIILVIVSIGLFFGFVRGQFTRNQELKEEVAVYADALIKAQELKERRDALQQKLISIGEENLNDLEKILPDSVDTVRMIMDLNGIAARHGILIQDIEIVDPNEAQASSGRGQGDTEEAEERALGYRDLDFSFKVTTTYDRFAGFLKDMEESLRIHDVTRIELKPTDNAGVYEIAVAAQTYWLK